MNTENGAPVGEAIMQEGRGQEVVVKPADEIRMPNGEPITERMMIHDLSVRLELKKLEIEESMAKLQNEHALAVEKLRYELAIEVANIQAKASVEVAKINNRGWGSIEKCATKSELIITPDEEKHVADECTALVEAAN